MHVFVLTRSAAVRLESSAASFWTCLRGNAGVRCVGRQFTLRAKQWLSLEEDAMPQVHAEADALVLGACLPTARLGIDSIALPHIHPGFERMSAAEARGCVSIWCRNFNYRHNQPFVEPYQEDAAACLLRQLARMQSSYAAMEARCPGRTKARRQQVFTKMQSIRLHIEGNLSKKIVLDDLASMMSKSRWNFTNIFKDVYDIRPQAYVSNRRLKLARQLLEETDLSVGEVGMLCGFENKSSFSRAFRTEIGVSPIFYRHGCHANLQERQVQLLHRGNQLKICRANIN